MRHPKPYLPQIKRKSKTFLLIAPDPIVSLKPKMTDEFPVERWFLVISLVSCIVGFGGFGLMMGVYLGITFSH